MGSISYSKPRRNRTWRWWQYLLLLTPIVVLVLTCEGFDYPILNKYRSLENRLLDDFGTKLPPGTTVTRAIYQPTQDPAAFYEANVGKGETATFVARILGVAKSKGWSVQVVDPSGPWTLGRVPSWWRATRSTDDVGVGISAPGTAGRHYLIYYSPSTGVISICWFET